MFDWAAEKGDRALAVLGLHEHVLLLGLLQLDALLVVVLALLRQAREAPPVSPAAIDPIRSDLPKTSRTAPPNKTGGDGAAARRSVRFEL
jgi:hypothetical protein